MQIDRAVAGPFRLEVRGVDAAGATLVRGERPRLEVRRGRTERTELYLDCFGVCPADASAPGPPGDASAPRADGGAAGRADGPDPGADAGRTCGNGRLDPGEACDVAIATRLSGACPTTCDDGIPCTIDSRVGTGCAAECRHVEIRAAQPGDRCCPAGATYETDRDCSPTCGNGAVEAGESCDRAIPITRAGACPTAQTCADDDRCTLDVLISAGTCAARCVHRAISELVSGDGCCPAGASNMTDSDCPVVCGNGVREAPERCDTAIPPNATDACPQSCDDKNACTQDLLEGAGCLRTCRFRPITELVSGDGCCPPGANRNLDLDCAPVCGNGIMEPGERCDRALPDGRAGACPAACAASPGSCLDRVLEGSPSDCSARCAERPTSRCALAKDGCCPADCTPATDGDCSTTCGNGRVDPGESCDVAIAAGTAGACPRACDDGAPCTADMLVSAGTCSARCQSTPISAFVAGDRCCPPGANAALDADCAPVCGNQVVEIPRETCDRGIATGTTGACPADCPPQTGCSRMVLMGDASQCTAQCVSEAITACQPADGCCPPGCHRNNDSDCAVVCGNGAVEPGEICDKAITAGNPGACPAICDDRNPCTTDVTSGRVDDCTRMCTFSEIKACAAGDRCCPMGCTAENDRDCAPPQCGNGHVEAGESCDPPSSCPTTCASDGDPCTNDVIQGDPAACGALCAHVPITACSGAVSDRCCPTGCSPGRDADCQASRP